MKKIGFIYLFVTLLSFALVACTYNDFVSDEPKEYSFSEINGSELQGVDMTLIDDMEFVTGHFTFDAPGTWRVSSDQETWITFSKELDGDYWADIEGNAENNIVYVRISDAGRGYITEKANIKFETNGKEYTVAVVERPGKKWLTILDKDGGAVDFIEIDYSATAWYSFNAPFDCGIVKFPEWIVEPSYENDGYRFSIIDSLDLLQNPLEGELVVSDKTMAIQKTIPVKYWGMDPAAMEIAGDTPWNWLASIDGKELKSKQTLDSVVIKANLEMSVVCRNNAYSLVFAEEVDSILYPKNIEDAWIKATHIDNDPRRVSVSVDAAETNDSRTGYLFAVPDAVCESFMVSLDLRDSTNVFVDKYQKYVLAQVEQRDSGFDVFLVDDGTETETKIPCSVDESADYYIIVSSNYFSGTAPDVTACNVELGKTYVINTKLTEDEWEGNFALLDINGEEVRIRTWIPKQKAVLDEDGYYKITVTIPEDAEWFEENEIAKDVVLCLRTPDIVNIKALVFRVQE